MTILDEESGGGGVVTAGTVVHPDDHVHVYLQISQPDPTTLHYLHGGGVRGGIKIGDDPHPKKPRVLRVCNETTVCIQEADDDEDVACAAAAREKNEDDSDDDDDDNSRGSNEEKSSKTNSKINKNATIYGGETMSFDRVFCIDATSSSPVRDECFDNVCAGIPEQLLQGYNCTVLAYGARGTGKTRSVLGKSRRRKKQRGRPTRIQQQQHQQLLHQHQQLQHLQRQHQATSTTNTATTTITTTTRAAEIATMTDHEPGDCDLQQTENDADGCNQCSNKSDEDDDSSTDSDDDDNGNESNNDDVSNRDEIDQEDKRHESTTGGSCTAAAADGTSWGDDDLDFGAGEFGGHDCGFDDFATSAPKQQPIVQDNDGDVDDEDGVVAAAVALLEDGEDYEYYEDEEDLDQEPGLVVRLAQKVFSQLQTLENENDNDSEEDEPMVQQKKPSPRELFAPFARTGLHNKSDDDLAAKGGADSRKEQKPPPPICKISLSIVEVYLERLIDLLHPASTAVLAPVHVLSNGALAGTTTLACVTAEDVEDCLRMAVARRMGSSFPGERDDHSHRSSLLVQLTVEQTTEIPNLDNEQEEIHTKLQVRKSVLQVYDLCDSDLALASSTAPPCGGEETFSSQLTRNLSSLQQQVQKRLPNRDMPILCRLLEPTWDGHASARVLVTVSSYETVATQNSLTFATECRKLALAPIQHVSTYYREQDREHHHHQNGHENTNPKEEEWLKRQARLTTLIHTLAGECQRLQKAKIAESSSVLGASGNGRNTPIGGGGGGLSKNRQVWQAIHEIDKVKAERRTLDFSIETKKEHEVRAEAFRLKTEKRQAEQERDAALATIAQVRSDLLVLKDQNESLQKQQQRMEEELQKAKSDVLVLQQRKQEVEYNLRTSQFRESESVVFLRQYRRFYMRLLQTSLMDGSTKNDTGDGQRDMMLDVLRNVPGAPDLTELVDMDRLMMESGLLEEAEVGQECPLQAYRPSRDALLRSTKGVENATKAASQNEGDSESDVISPKGDEAIVDLSKNPDGTSIVQRPEACETTEARQRLYKTPAGRFLAMREKALERDLLRLTENYVKIKCQLAEEKANVDAMTGTIGTDAAKEKLAAAREIKKLRDRLDRKDNDLKAVIWKLNEMHIVGKSFQEKCVDREQHVAHLEESLLTVQSENGSLLRERVESVQQMQEELRCLRQRVHDLTMPIWQLSRSRPKEAPLHSRLVLPFSPSAAALENIKEPMQRRLSLGETEEWVDMKFDFRPVGVQVVEAEVQTDLGGKEMDLQKEEIAALRTKVECSEDELAETVGKVTTLATELEETQAEQARVASELGGVKAEQAKVLSKLERAKAEQAKLQAELEHAKTVAPVQIVHVAASEMAHTSAPVTSISQKADNGASQAHNSEDEEANDDDDSDSQTSRTPKEMSMSELLFMEDSTDPDPDSAAGTRSSIYNGLVDAYNNVSIQTDKGDNTKPPSPEVPRTPVSFEANSTKREPAWKAAQSRGQPSWKPPNSTSKPATTLSTEQSKKSAWSMRRMSMPSMTSQSLAQPAPSMLSKSVDDEDEDESETNALYSVPAAPAPAPAAAKTWMEKRAASTRQLDDDDGANKEPEWMMKFKTIGARNIGEAVIETSGGSEAKELTRTCFGETLKRNHSADGGHTNEPLKPWSPRKKKDDDDESIDSFTRGFLKQAGTHMNDSVNNDDSSSSSSDKDRHCSENEDDSESEDEKEKETLKSTPEPDRMEDKEAVTENKMTERVVIEEESFDRKKLNSLFQAKAAVAKPLVPVSSYAPSYSSTAKTWTPKPKKTDEDSDGETGAGASTTISNPTTKDDFSDELKKDDKKGDSDDDSSSRNSSAPSKPKPAEVDDSDSDCSSEDESKASAKPLSPPLPDKPVSSIKEKSDDSDDDDSSVEESNAAPSRSISPPSRPPRQPPPLAKPAAPAKKKSNDSDTSSDEESTGEQPPPPPPPPPQPASPVKKKSFPDDDDDSSDEELTTAPAKPPTPPPPKPAPPVKKKSFLDDDSDSDSEESSVSKSSSIKPSPPALIKSKQESDGESEEEEVLPPKPASPAPQSKTDHSDSSSDEQDDDKGSTLVAKPNSSAGDDADDSCASSVEEEKIPAAKARGNAKQSEGESSDDESDDDESVSPKKTLSANTDNDSDSENDRDDDNHPPAKNEVAVDASFDAFCERNDKPAVPKAATSTSFFDDGGMPDDDPQPSRGIPDEAPVIPVLRKNEKVKQEKEKKSKFVIKDGKLVKGSSSRSMDEDGKLVKGSSSRSMDASSDDGFAKVNKVPAGKSKMFVISGGKLKSGPTGPTLSKAMGKQGKKKAKFVIKGGKLIQDDSSIGVTSIASMMTQKTGQKAVRRNSLDSKTDEFDQKAASRRAEELTQRKNRTTATSMMPAPRPIKIQKSSQPSFKILDGKIVKSEEPVVPAQPAFSIINGKLVKADSIKKKKKGDKKGTGKKKKDTKKMALF